MTPNWLPPPSVVAPIIAPMMLKSEVTPPAACRSAVVPAVLPAMMTCESVTGPGNLAPPAFVAEFAVIVEWAIVRPPPRASRTPPPAPVALLPEIVEFEITAGALMRSMLSPPPLVALLPEIVELEIDTGWSMS